MGILNPILFNRQEVLRQAMIPNKAGAGPPASPRKSSLLHVGRDRHSQALKIPLKVMDEYAKAWSASKKKLEESYPEFRSRRVIQQ